eukprot:85397-Ditylum_brightwellii.AAC.1
MKVQGAIMKQQDISMSMFSKLSRSKKNWMEVQEIKPMIPLSCPLMPELKRERIAWTPEEWLNLYQNL